MAATDVTTSVTRLKDLPGIEIKAMPRVLGRLTLLALRYPVRAALAVGSALTAAVLTVITPRLLGASVNQAHNLFANPDMRLHPAEARTLLLHLACLTIAAAAGRGVVTGFQGYLGEYLAQRVGYDLRLAFFQKLQVLSFSYHDAVHSGELITRGMLDLEGVRAFLESGLLRVVMLAFLLVAGSWRLIEVDATTGCLALSFVPFVVWRAARMGALLRVSWMRLQQLMSELTRTIEESLQGMRVVRAFASKTFELAKFDVAAAAALRLSNQRITLRMGSVTIMNLAYYTAMGLVLLVGGRRVAGGTLTVGALTEILTFMTLLQQPVRQIGMIVNSSARATSAGGRLFEILDLEPDIRDAPGVKDLVVDPGILRFEDVSFAYDGGPAGARSTIEHISFEVRPGRTLAIVGPPGSGKSTIAQLVPRFYDVAAGRITIDGQDIRSVTLASLRQAVALVQQDLFLFDATIHENIAYVDPWAETERVVGAASVAQIHDHVAQLPEGYGTMVGERGVALSGGQRQRLSIARGLVADPSIMVFDDSTAAIDAATERQVRAELARAVGSKATIIIAHRLSSLHHADEIIMLDVGRIVERGTHAELLRRGGSYAALWRLQNGEETVDRILEAQS